MNLLVLAPLFLLGLGTLLVPVIVHLIHKHKREAVPFPSLMFIQRIPFKDVRRQQLRGNLTNLRTLDLSYNELTSLPESIRSLRNLTFLYVSHNQWTSLPESLENLTNLKVLLS